MWFTLIPVMKHLDSWMGAPILKTLFVHYVYTQSWLFTYVGMIAVKLYSIIFATVCTVDNDGSQIYYPEVVDWITQAHYVPDQKKIHVFSYWPIIFFANNQNENFVISRLVWKSFVIFIIYIIIKFTYLAHV